MLHFWGLDLNFDRPMIGNAQSGIPILAKGTLQNTAETNIME